MLVSVLLPSTASTAHRRRPARRWLRAKRVNQLYVIGGDGTHRGAYKLAELCWEKGVDVSVAGVPKTIDNDIGA